MADRLRSSIRAEKKQQSVVRSRRESLCKAMTDLRVMESMCKRERLEWMAQWQDAERKTMDESATMVFLRKTGNQKAHAEWTQNGEPPT
jgi:flagellar biosynthesis chaperone FliJ